MCLAAGYKPAYFWYPVAVWQKGGIMRTRVKICGITRIEDGLAAAAAGADAIGLVFHPPSPRAVDIEQARAIATAMPPFVSVTALFVDAGRERVREVLDAVPVDLLQFHGHEPAQDCEGFGRPWIKAVAMREGVDLAAVMNEYAAAAGILVDAWHPELPGGSGERFDWDLLPADPVRPLILAGGLNAGNVGEAVNRVRPWAVDVSSGVEREKGIKDPDAMTRFVRAVWAA